MTERSLSDVEYNYKLINERIAEAAENRAEKEKTLLFLRQQKQLTPM